MVIQPVEFWFSCGQSICIHTAKRNALVVNAAQGASSPITLLQKLPSGVDVVYAIEGAPEYPQRALAILGQGLRYTIFPPYHRYYIDIEGSYESYLSKFGGRTRATWRRKLTKLERVSGGPVCWRAFTRAEEMVEFHRLARQVAKTTYQEKLYNSGIPDTPDFLEQLKHNANTDLIRGYILFLNQQPIAYTYCYAIDDVLVGSKLGYDPEFAKLNPGTILLHLVLESLFGHDRFRRFDFGRGEFSYKEHYSTAQLRCVDTFYFPRTAENLAFAAAHFGTALVSRSISRSLATIGIKDAVKRGLGIFAARRHGVLRPSALDEGGRS
jgi:GNAT acetyltransferase-like protein